METGNWKFETGALRACKTRVAFVLLGLSLLAVAGARLKGQAMSSTPAGDSQANVPLGFSPQSYAAERRWEARLLAIPDAARCESFARRLTSRPHVAGTPGDLRVSRYIYDQFQRDGLNPRMVEYRVLLSYPKKVALDLVAPDRVRLANPEPAVPGDKATRPRDPLAQVPWNAYSPSANLTAAVVYVNYGTAEDYAQLEQLGLSARGRLVLVRYFHGYRGGKSLEAEKHGALGVLVYSDPADDGALRGPVYPRGPWGPQGHFQRGSVVFDFQVPGDPLTPGWASTPSARRIPESESRILPRIPMLPLSASDAAEILKRLGGPAVPKTWQGGLPYAYRAGDDTVRARLALEMENRVTPIWDVIGTLPGSAEPEKQVILSNHHDAWVYGAVDPVSGTATMLEAAHALGQLAKEGFRPRRTIVFGNWDAEEYTLTGSTEWGEEHEEALRKNAVVCLNVDASTSGQDFSVSAVPALLPALIEAARAVRDPATGRSVYDRWKQQRAGGNIRSYALGAAAPSPVPFGVLGGGSDFMVFLQHDGVPSLDMLFDGPYGVYHSVYDDFAWMSRYGDPGFRYHAAMSRLWALLALRFANADVLPLDYAPYAAEVSAYLAELAKLAPEDFAAQQLQPASAECEAWRSAAAHLTQHLEDWRQGKTAGLAPAPMNAALMAEERALLDERGIPGRPWFRHLVYAPLPSYEAETLPGLREALEAKDLRQASEQAQRLREALGRALRALSNLP